MVPRSSFGQSNQHQPVAISLEIFFVGLKHPVEPWQQLLGAVIAEEKIMVEILHPKVVSLKPVQDNGHSIMLGHQPDMLCTSDGTQYRSLLTWSSISFTSIREV